MKVESSEKRDAGGADEKISDNPLMIAVASAVAERDALTGGRSEAELAVIEAEVLGVCITAIARLPLDRRLAVLEYLRDRFKGYDYLELAANIARESSVKMAGIRAENWRLQRIVDAMT